MNSGSFVPLFALGVPGLVLGDPLADGGVDGGVHDGLVEVDDEEERARFEVCCGLALGALRQGRGSQHQIKEPLEV